LILFPTPIGYGIRGAQFAAESDRNHKLMFADNTPDGLLKLLTGQELPE
jgi:hypothetical protein